MKQTNVWILIFLAGCVMMPPFAFAGKKEDAKKIIDALNQKVKAAGEKGDLQGAIDAAEEVLEVTTKAYGEKSLESARAMNNVANLYLYADHADNAERLYKNMILILIKRLNHKDLEIADAYYNLAMAYAVQKKFDPARKMLNDCYKIRAEKLGENHADTQKARKALDDIWSDTPSSL